MKKNISVALFGSSGRTGKEVITEASKHGVTVRIDGKRNPSLDDVCRLMRGADGAIIVFGPKPPYTDIFCEKTTKTIVDAMKSVGVKRLICQTGAMIGEYPKNRSMFFELMSSKYRKYNPLGQRDRAQQEKVIMESNLDWTIVKPPRLTNGSMTEKISVGTDIGIGLFSSISRKTLAKFMVEEFLHPQYIKKIIFIKSSTGVRK